MQIPRNALKRALAEGRTQIGLFLGMADGHAAEIVAGAGFDWLLVDGEHGPNDLRSVRAQLQSLAAWPVAVPVRIPDHDPARIKQLLDVGVQTLLVPMVESGDQARALVRAMRYPPAGVRGVGTALARAAHWGGVEGYLQRADAEMCLIVQVESRAGLDALGEILAVEGVDGVFIGPSDLAASLGHLGDSAHPEVVAAVEQSIARIAAAGKAPGVFSTDPALARRYRELGARFIAVGADTLLLRRAAQGLAQLFGSGAG